MAERINVQLSEKTLFDFLLFHTYSKLAGFLTNVLGTGVGFMGIILLITGKATVMNCLFYFIAAIAFLSFTPLQLRFRAKKAFASMPRYHNEQPYTFDERGICVGKGDGKKCYDWSQVRKVVATPKTIGYYYTDDDALIIPKEDFNDAFLAIMRLTVENVPPQNIKMK